MPGYRNVTIALKRMCAYFRDKDAGCVDGGCPLATNPVCGSLEEADEIDIMEAENAIVKWAREHPVPVYPTWREWLKQEGVISDFAPTALIATDKAKEPIPKEMAEKLDISPKEWRA